MRYIITEEQEKILIDKMESLLTSFCSSHFICNIKISHVHPEEDDYKKGLRYDVYVELSLKDMKEFNHMGQKNIQLSIKNKIIEFLKSWFSLSDNQFYIGFTGKEC